MNFESCEVAVLEGCRSVIRVLHSFRRLRFAVATVAGVVLMCAFSSGCNEAPQEDKARPPRSDHVALHSQTNGGSVVSNTQVVSPSGISGGYSATSYCGVGHPNAVLSLLSGPSGLRVSQYRVVSGTVYCNPFRSALDCSLWCTHAIPRRDVLEVNRTAEATAFVRTESPAAAPVDVGPRGGKARHYLGWMLWRARVRAMADLQANAEVTRELRFRSAGFPRANYRLLLPPRLDLSQSYPLMILLHGGGPGRSSASDVYGTPSYVQARLGVAAQKAGWIVALPQALHADWAVGDNRTFVRRLMAELLRICPVDPDVVVLGGFSMGAIGAWKLAVEDPSGLSGVACFGGDEYEGVLPPAVAVYLQHGSADSIVRSSDARRLASRLLEARAQFVYAETRDTGHTIPESAAEEAVRAFSGLKAENEGRVRLPSWVAMPPHPAELIGDAYLDFTTPSDDLVGVRRALRLGGVQAQRVLRGLSPGGSAPELADLLARFAADEREDAASRGLALWSLGRIGGASWREALRAGCGSPPSPEACELVCRAASALRSRGVSELLPEAWNAWLNYLQERLDSAGSICLIELRRVGTVLYHLAALVEGHDEQLDQMRRALRGVTTKIRRVSGPRGSRLSWKAILAPLFDLLEGASVRSDLLTGDAPLPPLGDM